MLDNPKGSDLANNAGRLSVPQRSIFNSASKIAKDASIKRSGSEICLSEKDRFAVHGALFTYASSFIKIATRYPKNLFGENSPDKKPLIDFLNNTKDVKGVIKILTDKSSLSRDGENSFDFLKNLENQYKGRIKVGIVFELPIIGSTPQSFMINDKNMYVAQIASTHMRGYSFNDPTLCTKLSTAFDKVYNDKKTKFLIGQPDKDDLLSFLNLKKFLP